MAYLSDVGSFALLANLLHRGADAFAVAFDGRAEVAGIGGGFGLRTESSERVPIDFQTIAFGQLMERRGDLGEAVDDFAIRIAGRLAIGAIAVGAADRTILDSRSLPNARSFRRRDIPTEATSPAVQTADAVQN